MTEPRAAGVIDAIQTIADAVAVHGRRDISIAYPSYEADVISHIPSSTTEQIDSAHSSYVKAHFSKAVPTWYPTLAAALDAAIVANKVSQSLRLLDGHRASDPTDDAALIEYHSNAWLFHSKALCEKSNELLTCVYRHLLRSCFAGADSTLAIRKSHISPLENGIAAIRNGLAHRGGGGVGALAEERLWELYVCTGVRIDLS